MTITIQRGLRGNLCVRFRAVLKKLKERPERIMFALMLKVLASMTLNYFTNARFVISDVIARAILVSVTAATTHEMHKMRRQNSLAWAKG